MKIFLYTFKILDKYFLDNFPRLWARNLHLHFMMQAFIALCLIFTFPYYSIYQNTPHYQGIILSFVLLTNIAYTLNFFEKGIASVTDKFSLYGVFLNFAISVFTVCILCICSNVKNESYDAAKTNFLEKIDKLSKNIYVERDYEFIGLEKYYFKHKNTFYNVKDYTEFNNQEFKSIYLDTSFEKHLILDNEVDLYLFENLMNNETMFLDSSNFNLEAFNLVINFIAMKSKKPEYEFAANVKRYITKYEENGNENSVIYDYINRVKSSGEIFPVSLGVNRSIVENIKNRGGKKMDIRRLVMFSLSMVPILILILFLQLYINTSIEIFYFASLVSFSFFVSILFHVESVLFFLIILSIIIHAKGESLLISDDKIFGFIIVFVSSYVALELGVYKILYKEIEEIGYLFSDIMLIAFYFFMLFHLFKKYNELWKFYPK